MKLKAAALLLFALTLIAASATAEVVLPSQGATDFATVQAAPPPVCFTSFENPAPLFLSMADPMDCGIFCNHCAKLGGVCVYGDGVHTAACTCNFNM